MSKILSDKKFSKLLQGLKHLPNGTTIKRIDSKMFPLDENKVFRYKPEVLAAEEYKRCLELLQRRLPQQYAASTQEALIMLQMNMQMVMNAIFVKEMRSQDSLKEIAVTTIRELFDIPEHVKLLPEISDMGGPEPEEQDDSPQSFLSLGEDDKKKMRDEIQKRIILNGLVHGSAMHIWKSAHYIIKERIDKLDPTLMMLYDQYTTSIGWMLWQMSPDQAQEAIASGGVMTQGFNEVKFEEEGEPDASIRCQGINFPVLLHEITKGAMDYLICRGIPSSYTEEQLEYYYAKADDYENEIWHYLLSPTLWMKLVDAADVDTQNIAAVIAGLCDLSYQELVDVMTACIDGPEVGRQKLKEKRII